MKLNRERIAVVPLGVDTRDFEAIDYGKDKGTGRQGDKEPRNLSPDPLVSLPPCPDSPPLTIGYLARLSPEKGLHVLAEAFIRLRKMPGTENARLRIAGWLGENNRAYAEQIFERLRAAGLGGRF